MMGGGEFKSSLVQQMMWSTGTDSTNMMSSLLMPACAEEQEASSPRIRMSPPLPSTSSMFLPHELLQISSDLAPEVNTSLASDLHDGQERNMPDSWSQLLLGGLVGDHKRYSAAAALLSKGLEEGPMPHQAAAAYNFYGHSGEEIQTLGTNKSQVSQMLLAASSPRSCVTTSLGSNVVDFSANSTVPPAPELRNHHSDNSSEINSNATGSAPKKARVQTSSTAQSTLKVRKERLGGRITALHQIVSPFGKTDTSTVLQETIGYIRFLLGQIEALSYPYMGHGAGNGNSMQQQQQITDVEEDHDGEKQDLRSRGLRLVPVSCTSHLADDGGASDFWAVAPPLSGIATWR